MDTERLTEEQLDAAQRWVDEVERAYADGGYAAGDGPPAPLDEMVALLAENKRLREQLDAAQLRSIEARNPGIDMDDVRRTRAGA